MEELKQSRVLKILFIIFIIVSAMHILYASISFRGLYMDGAFYMMKQLNWLSEGTFSIATEDPAHPRFFSLFITQIPVIIAYFFLFIKNKFILMFIYSFAQLTIPLISLYWSYRLAIRTNKIDIFFWNLFTYCGIILLYEIFSVTESIHCIPFHFILWNYLTAKMEYNKKDIICIIFLSLIMFFSYEYMIYLGIFFFLCHFYYVLQEKNAKHQLIKTFIGFSSLGAACYTIWFMLNTKGEKGEILRFLGEGINVIPQMFHLNTLITIAAFIMLLIFAFKKTKIKTVEIYLITIVFYLAIRYLLTNLDLSVFSMWEVHLRTIPCWWIMFTFFVLHFKDLISPKYNMQRWHNLICIALLCGIFQSFWQMNDTYFWNRNIKYMKSELANNEGVLYIPHQHEEISSFGNKHLRRYIWHSFYAITSVLFSDTYKQKTLLLHYDREYDENNMPFRELLYTAKNRGKIVLPVGVDAAIKNEWWDLTECAEALDKYNKENNIKTAG